MRIVYVSIASLLISPAFGDDLISAPSPSVVRDRVLEWAKGIGADAAKQEKLTAQWADATAPLSGERLLAKVIESFVLVDQPTADFIAQLNFQGELLTPPDTKTLSGGTGNEFYRDNLRLHLSRYLLHQNLFEEALLTLTEAKIENVVDPATYLFVKASCEKSLLLKKEGIETIDRLLKNTEGVPVRYQSVATLMRLDLEALEDKSLEEVSWKMDDIRRRLDLARPGEKTQKVEREVVESLDEIIKKIEEQQGGGGGMGGNSNQSSNPANDSSVKGSTAPGNIDKRKLANRGGWGNITPKERAKVKNRLLEEFPAHYNEVIEEYFKKLAGRKPQE